MINRPPDAACHPPLSVSQGTYFNHPHYTVKADLWQAYLMQPDETSQRQLVLSTETGPLQREGGSALCWTLNAKSGHKRAIAVAFWPMVEV